MNNILIITGGNINEEFARKFLKTIDYDMVIAVDKGLLMAHKLGVPVDHIVGDFDSVPQEILEAYRNKSAIIHSFPPVKDKTDSHIGMDLALDHKPQEIIILGALGSRIDHSLGNLFILDIALQKKVHAYIIDENNKIYFKNDNFSISKSKGYGDFVSLLPFTEEVRGINLKGFKYPLSNANIKKGDSIGISNEIINSIGFIEIQQGTLIIIESKD